VEVVFIGRYADHGWYSIAGVLQQTG